MTIFRKKKLLLSTVLGFLFSFDVCLASGNQISPIDIPERLMYSTVRILRDDGGIGTGFFFKFPLQADEKKAILTLITNKHVIRGSQHSKLILHGIDVNGKPTSQRKSNTLQTSDWVEHPTADLCAAYLPATNGTHPFFYEDIIAKDIIPHPAVLNGLSALEEIIMVGYPNGIYDQTNNFPIFRRGVTSSHPAVPLNDREEFLIDAACFTGSSGSPVFVYNAMGYSDKRRNRIMSPRVLFLGVLRAAPYMTTEGEILVREIPTSFQSYSVMQTLMHLGYVIKSSEIEGLRGPLEKRAGLNLSEISQVPLASSSSSSSSALHRTIVAPDLIQPQKTLLLDVGINPLETNILLYKKAPENTVEKNNILRQILFSLSEKPEQMNVIRNYQDFNICAEIRAGINNSENPQEEKEFLTEIYKALQEYGQTSPVSPSDLEIDLSTKSPSLSLTAKQKKLQKDIQRALKNRAKALESRVQDSEPVKKHTIITRTFSDPTTETAYNHIQELEPDLIARTEENIMYDNTSQRLETLTNPNYRNVLDGIRIQSRRLTKTDRFVYQFNKETGNLHILGVDGHYDSELN